MSDRFKQFEDAFRKAISQPTREEESDEDEKKKKAKEAALKRMTREIQSIPDIQED